METARKPDRMGTLVAAALAALLIGSTGCMKTRPADPAGFAPNLDPAGVRDSAPFQRGWVSGDASRIKPGDYREVSIAPVDIDLLKESDWWQSQSTARQADLEKDARELAGFMQNEFEQAFRQYPQKEFKVVGRAGPGTIVIELALVELRPSKVYWNALSTTAGLVLPGANALNAAGKGSVALEGRIRAGKGGWVIASFADREVDVSAVLNLRGSTKFYGHAQSHIERWAKQLAEVFFTPRDHEVKDAPGFKLIVW
jgi:hypothetical protein